MEVNVSFPKAPSVKLRDLYKGNCFILSSALYRPYTTVYAAVETPCNGYVKCFNFNNCCIDLLHGNSNVIEVIASLNVRPMTDAERNALPF